MSDLLTNLFTSWKPTQSVTFPKTQCREHTHNISSAFSDLLNGGIAHYSQDRDGGITIYGQECDDGLYQSIANNSTSLYSPIFPPNSNTIALGEASNQTKDTYSFAYILASVGTNKNDDHFERGELWSAAGSATNKPINLLHKPRTIIGVMLGAEPVDSDYTVIADDNPSSIAHLRASGLLYRHLKSRDSELEQEAQTIITEVQNGEWFVSMECLFNNFDYIYEDGEIVKRSEGTSYLSRHLRVYGGSGSYNGKKIYRVLRDIIFSGVGLVKNPANPQSVIL